MIRGIERPIQPAPGRPYVPVIRAGEWVYTGGYTGFEKNGRVPKDFSRQYQLIIEKARRNLDAAGASLEQVIQVMVYLTHLSDYPALNSLFAKTFSRTPPARTCVQVKGLSSPAKRIEMQFVAYLGRDGVSM